MGRAAVSFAIGLGAVSIAVAIVIAKAQIDEHIWYRFILKNPYVVPSLICFSGLMFLVALREWHKFRRVCWVAFTWLIPPHDERSRQLTPVDAPANFTERLTSNIPANADQLVWNWRKMATEVHNANQDSGITVADALMAHASYPSLRPHLSEAIKSEIHTPQVPHHLKPRLMTIPMSTVDPVLNGVYEAIDRKAREWGLPTEPPPIDALATYREELSRQKVALEKEWGQRVKAVSAANEALMQQAKVDFLKIGQIRLLANQAEQLWNQLREFSQAMEMDGKQALWLYPLECNFPEPGEPRELHHLSLARFQCIYGEHWQQVVALSLPDFETEVLKHQIPTSQINRYQLIDALLEHKKALLFRAEEMMKPYTESAGKGVSA